MRYLMLVCVDPSLEADATPEETDAWVESVGSARLDGNALRSPREAVTVRVRRSERLDTDGPFAETKEFVAGFDILECESREEALEIAAAHPVARFGAIEVREFWED